MNYFVIAAYVVLAFAVFLADGKKQFLYATIAVALCSVMAFTTWLEDDVLWTTLTHFGVGTAFALFCGIMLSGDDSVNVNKNQYIAAFLALLLGSFGIHKYYLKRYGSALMYMLFSWTGIPFCLSIIEFLYFIFVSKKAFYAKYNVVETKKVQKVKNDQAKPVETPANVQKPDQPEVAVTPEQKPQQSAPAPVVVSADMVDVGTENTSINQEMVEKYTAVQFVLDDALQKANEIEMLGEKEGHELAVIREMLNKLNKDFSVEVEKLKNTSEWDRFCIAFFGETNAGKSTIIESLRIIYDEESKRVAAMEQEAEYYHLMKQHCADYRNLISSLETVNALLKENYGRRKRLRTYFIIGLVSLIVGFVCGMILVNLGIFVW